MINLRREWNDLAAAAKAMDRQVVFVLAASVVMVLLQTALGGRAFFHRHLAEYFDPQWRELLSWGWWFSLQAILGFILPAASLLLFFGRKPREIGLGLGDWKLALLVALLYLPLVAVGTWVLSADPAFLAKYPHCRMAVRHWGIFAVCELWFVLYWLGWEYLWRGFVLFGTAHRFGHYAIIIQMVPFALLHLYKPLPEALLSVVGGVALGILVWRCRSFWIAVPIHALQMLFMDLWCVLRIRTGATGIGLDALHKLF